MGQSAAGLAGQSYAIRLMEHLVVPTFVLDPTRRVVVWNRACERLTGVSADEVLGTRAHWKGFYGKRRYCLADLVALGRPDKLPRLYPQYAEAKDTLRLSAENWCVMPRRGNRLYLAIDAGPIHDEAGRLIAVVETLRDMTDQKRAEGVLKALASSDSLTNLANRRAFDQTIVSEWNRGLRTRRPLSLLMIDIDHFKLYNDLHGHQSGDTCLKRVAAAISDRLRPADLAARYGGEEFAVIMPETSASSALRVAQQVLDRVHACQLPHGATGAGPRVSVSIGVASIVPCADGALEQLIVAADRALYAAKRSGRNTVRLATDMGEVKTPSRSRLVDEARRIGRRR